MDFEPDPLPRPHKVLGISSTYCSDPEVTHIVECLDARMNGYGSGIFGYYRSRDDALKVSVFIQAHGATQVAVAPYRDDGRPGFHPLAELGMFGHIE